MASSKILIFQNKFFDQPKKEEIADNQDINNSKTEIIENVSPKKNELSEE